jgi:hypothetical protein
LAAVGGCALRKPVGHRAERIERFDALVAVERLAAGAAWI